ncbi:MAG: GntR family transcriptional regulator [Desulfuromonadales bacterium]
MREEVYKTLLMWIMEGELRPGEKLLDKELANQMGVSELANQMGVSRTPVREALRRLEDKNLVESSANRWTRVTDISVEEPAKIYPIIWTLEELAIEQALPKMTAADLDRMEMANDSLEHALSTNDPVRASRADAQFHDVFIEATDNPFLITILQDLKIRYRRVEVTYFEGSSLQIRVASENSVNRNKILISVDRWFRLSRICKNLDASPILSASNQRIPARHDRDPE